MHSVTMLSLVIIYFFMVNVVVLNVITLSAVMLNVIMMNIVALRVFVFCKSFQPGLIFVSKAGAYLRGGSVLAHKCLTRLNSPACLASLSVMKKKIRTLLEPMS